jgi:hypothetical protein
MTAASENADVPATLTLAGATVSPSMLLQTHDACLGEILAASWTHRKLSTLSLSFEWSDRFGFFHGIEPLQLDTSIP